MALPSGWADYSYATASTLFEVIWDASAELFIIHGTSGEILTSPDGQVWTLRSSPAASPYIGSATNGSGFSVAASWAGSTVLSPAVYSTDGVTWNTSFDIEGCQGVDYLESTDRFYFSRDEGYVIEASQANIIAGSGAIEYSRLLPTDVNAKGVTEAGGGTFAWNTYGTDYTGGQLFGWNTGEAEFTEITNPLTSELGDGLIDGYSDGSTIWAYCSRNGRFITSPTGVDTWTEQYIATSEDLHVLRKTPNVYIVAGGNGVAFQSTDLVAFAPIDTETTDVLYGVGSNSTTTVICGQNGFIISGPNLGTAAGSGGGPIIGSSIVRGLI